jgi:hypothetical protein
MFAGKFLHNFFFTSHFAGRKVKIMKMLYGENAA